MKDKESLPDKHVKISYENHQSLRKLAFIEKREMREITNEALELYFNKKEVD